MDGFYSLVHVGSQSDLCYINISVRHGDHAEVFFLSLFACCRKFSDSCGRGGFRGLAARVGVNFRIQYENVDVFSGRKDMIQTTEADIVCPAVAAEDPLALFNKMIFQGEDFFIFRMRRDFCVQRGFQFFRPAPSAVPHIFSGKPFFYSRFCVFIRRRKYFIQFLLHPPAQFDFAQMHAEAEFRIVLKEGICPCGPLAFRIGAVRHGRSACSVNGGTACGVGNKHSVTEEIGDQVDVRRFTAACAGTGKLKVCRFKLGAADSEFIHRVFLTGERDGVIPVFLLVKLRFNRFHDESLFRGGAYIGADAAAVAVFRTDDDAVFQSLFRPRQISADESFRRTGFFLLGHNEGPDGGMGADKSALIAGNTVFRDPFRNLDGRGRTFVVRCACGERAVFPAFKCGNGKIISFLPVHDVANVSHEIGTVCFGNKAAFGRMRPFFGDGDLNGSRDTRVDSRIIHVDYVLAFPPVGMFIGVFQVFHSICFGNDLCQMEESGLHNHIDPSAETDFLRDFKSINDVKFRMERGQLPFQRCRKSVFQVFRSPLAVQEKDAALFEAAEQVILIHVGRAVAGDIVRFADEVGFADRIGTETEMGNGHAAGFLGIVSKVSLGVHIRVVANDFNGALVGADGTV